jgi:hypothetical protein
MHLTLLESFVYVHIGVLVQRIHILANGTREEKRILRYDSYAGPRKIFFILEVVINY